MFWGGQDLFKRITNTNDSQHISHNFNETQTNWGGKLGGRTQIWGAKALLAPLPPSAATVYDEILQEIENEKQQETTKPDM